jgi:hypothetical protein
LPNYNPKYEKIVRGKYRKLFPDYKIHLHFQPTNLLLKLRAEMTAAAAGEPVTLDARKAEAVRGFARTLQRGASAELAADLEPFIALDWDGLTRPSQLH